MRNKLLLTLVLPLLLAGCATWGPTWSEVTGQRFTRTNINRFPAIIESIDGGSAFVSDPIRIQPGLRRVQLQGPSMAMGRAGGGDLVNFELNAEPCKRYYLNAQMRNNLQTEFEPVIDFVETIAGCTVPAPAK